MLNVDGQPSRSSVIHFINIENLLTNTNEHIAQLFHLVENETSPFMIARKGRVALAELEKQDKDNSKYIKYIVKTL